MERKMDIVTLGVQLLSGAVGGNIGGAIFQKLSLGTLGNSIVGILGGGLGGYLLQTVLGVGGAAGGLDLQSIISQVASGGVGGTALMVVIGIIKSVFAKA